MYIFETETSNKRKISKLSPLRDNLLPKLMNGEIEVNKVEL